MAGSGASGARRDRSFDIRSISQRKKNKRHVAQPSKLRNRDIGARRKVTKRGIEEIGATEHFARVRRPGQLSHSNIPTTYCVNDAVMSSQITSICISNGISI